MRVAVLGLAAFAQAARRAAGAVLRLEGDEGLRVERVESLIAISLAGLGAVEEPGGATTVGVGISSCIVAAERAVADTAGMILRSATRTVSGKPPTTSSLPSWTMFAGQRPAFISP